jgi:hypothetical protein
MNSEVPRNQYSKLRSNKNLLKLVTNEHIIKLDKILSVEYNILISISDLKRSFTNIKSQTAIQPLNIIQF